jgi:hypothetical protein
MAYLGGGRDQALRQTFYFLATAGQTVFSGPDQNGFSLNYKPGFLNVRVNGLDAVNGVDYTATTGNSITIASPLTALDVVTVEAFGTFAVPEITKGTLGVPAWKPIPTADPWVAPGTLGSVGFPIPAGFKQLRGQMFIASDTVTADNTLFFRVSADGGATYRTGTNDYIGSYIYHTGTTVAAASNQALGYARIGLLSNNVGIAQFIQFELAAYQAIAAPLYRSFANGNDANGSNLTLRSGYLNTGAFNHIMFACLNGQLFKAGSYIMLEYI